MKNKMQYRIKYYENWNGMGEFYVFEGKRTNEKEWSFDIAFKLDEDDRINYQALTKIRELKSLGIDFYFA